MQPTETYRIVPVEGAGYMILGPTGEVVRSNQDWTTKEVAFASLSESLLKDRGGLVITYHPEGAEARIEVVDEDRSPEPAESFKLVFAIPPEMETFLTRMAREMGVNRAEVIRKSLGLMRIALDAKKEGNRVAILTPDMESDRDIEGI